MCSWCIIVLDVMLLYIVKCDVLSHIKTLDYFICQGLEHPEPGGGQQLSDQLLQMYMKLDEIHDMLRDEREAGMKIVQDILNAGGIKLPSIKPNYKTIMNIFNWSVDESKVLGVTFKDTVEMWKNIELGMEIVPTTEIDYNLNQENKKK